MLKMMALQMNIKKRTIENLSRNCNDVGRCVWQFWRGFFKL